jgi:WD40 repeat protein
MSISPGGAPAPGTDTWVAAIHGDEDGRKVLGSGFLVDTRRVITCAHVAAPGRSKQGGLWVALPKSGDFMHRRIPVSRVIFPDAEHDIRDVSVLVLQEEVPLEMAARIRRPAPGDLVGDTWWSFGFPDGDMLGNSSKGIVGESLAYGWVRLDTKSEYPVKRGYSGAALWSSRYQAVVGVVGQAQGSTGNARALSLWQAEKALPEEKIGLLAEWTAEAAGESALAAWGWSLNADTEAGRHWRPRARGVSTDAERGYRFCGREKALKEVVSWITSAAPQRRALVVTGSPGVGKSAVLGRIVTTADAGVVTALPKHDTAVRAPVGSVACAVHAKGMTAVEVARDIARAASAPMCDTVSDLVPSLRAVLSSQPARHFAVIIDALDEATTPKEARTIITEIIRPLVESCTDLLVHVVAGTRKQDDAGDILASFGPAARVVNLDEKRYSEEQDLASYARASLQLVGDERPGNPYADDEVAGPLAARIAILANGNFLIAGLVARTHGLYDTDAASPETLTFRTDENALSEALRGYLDLLPSVGNIPATTALAALAYAEEPGFPFDLWRAAIKALAGRAPSEYELRDFALSSAANFLVETSSAPQGAGAFRIFHQALNDALLKWRAESDRAQTDEREIAHQLLGLGRASGWQSAHTYLLRSLPRHASNGLLIDELLLDNTYVLHADLRRLIPASANAISARGRDRARLLRKTSRAIDAPPEVRVAMLSITESQEKLGSEFRTSPVLTPYRATWAAVSPQVEQATLEGHTGKISGICEAHFGDTRLLVTASDDRTVRVWDASTGENVHTLYGHGSRVRAVCALQAGDTPLLASISNESINVWDAVTSDLLHSFQGQNNGICGICSVFVGGNQLLAAATFEEVRILDPLTGSIIRRLNGHQGIVYALCSSTLGGRSRLISAGRDAIRVWDAETGALLRTLGSHARHVSDVCVIEVSGRPLVVCGGVPEFEVDGDPEGSCLLIWDMESGEQVFDLPLYEGRADSLCPVEINGSQLLAVATAGDVQLWDLSRDEPEFELWGRQQNAYALCATRAGGRAAIAVAGDDAVRIWDPTDGAAASDWHDDNQEVYELCTLRLNNKRKIAGAGLTVVRVWEPETGKVLHAVSDDRSYITAICSLDTGRGSDSLVIGDQDGMVTIWDVATGTSMPVLSVRRGAVHAICSIDAPAMRPLLAIGDHSTIRIAEPVTWRTIHSVDAHQNAIYAMCAARLDDGTGMLFSADSDELKAWEVDQYHVKRLRWHAQNGAQKLVSMKIDGRTLLVSASFDTVAVWDAGSGEILNKLGILHNSVNSLCPVKIADRELLATVHHDRILRLWDISSSGPRVELNSLDDKKPLLAVPVRYRAPSLTCAGGQLAVGLSDGLLALSISPEVVERVSPSVVASRRGQAR